MEIEKIVNAGATENILKEVYFMEQLSYYPLLVNALFAFQSETHLFLGMDLMLGGDLKFHMEKQRKLTEDTIRFWTAELAITVHYLHKRDIIHRDIKPQNILIDDKGKFTVSTIAIIADTRVC
jgi:serine/threonine kinase 32